MANRPPTITPAVTLPALQRSDDRWRTLRAASRFAEVPAARRIELSPDGTDYAVTAGGDDDSFAAGWAVLRLVLEDAHRKLTRLDVLDEWPDDYPKPGLVVLWRWLERAVADGRVKREGAGRRLNPFRYWLPEKEKEL